MGKVNNSRRGLLLVGGLYSMSFLIPSSVSSLMGLDSEDSKYVVFFDTIFKNPMTQNEYDDLMAKYINHSEADKLYSQYDRENKIIKSHVIHTGDKNQWIVVFDGKSSYYKWCYEIVGKGILSDHGLLDLGLQTENYGFRIDNELADKSLETIIDSLKGKKREFLHQTKTTADLGEKDNFSIS